MSVCYRGLYIQPSGGEFASMEHPLGAIQENSADRAACLRAGGNSAVDHIYAAGCS